MGANRISTLKYFEVTRLAPHIARKPRPSTTKDRRAPARLTKKPALALIATIKSKPSHGCGECSGASPPATGTTHADCRASIRPMQQNQHGATPAAKGT